tara:strand:- start:301 stop:831 length:531 start_codon:yes stop_codon:yes gene_type:complete
MAIKTMAGSTSGGKFNEGWHRVTISDAKYGSWNEKRYIETKFEGYPDNFTLRIYEAINPETHEEFTISRLFKLANAGLIDKITSPDGKEAIQYDDEPNNLVGKDINVFLYKNAEGYNRLSDRIAPIEQEGEVVKYNAEQVQWWKDQAEEHWVKRLKPRADAPATNPTTEQEENIPF